MRSLSSLASSAGSRRALLAAPDVERSSGSSRAAVWESELAKRNGLPQLDRSDSVWFFYSEASPQTR